MKELNYIYLIIYLPLIISVVLLLSVKDNKKFFELNNNHKRIISFALVLILLFVYLYHLGIIPRGIHIDEIGMAYDGLMLSKHGVDRYGVSYPVYLRNYDGGQSVLYVYLYSILCSIVPKTIFLYHFDLALILIRFPAVILNLFGLIAFYFIFRLKNNSFKSLLLTFIIGTCPFSIMHSRWALDCYLLYPMLIISFCFLYYAIEKKKDVLYFTSGISFGITLYSYITSYLIIFIFVSSFGIYLLLKHRINIKQALLFAIPLFVVALPLITMVFINVFDLPEIKIGLVTIPRFYLNRVDEFSFRNIFIVLS